MRFLIYCEADADRRIACTLADRVILERVPWADGVLDSLRTWSGLNAGESYTRIDKIPMLARERGIKAHGFGTGDGKVARLACLLALRCNPLPDGVLWIRDTDGDPTRIEAPQEAPPDLHFVLVAGFPHPKRECWVLAGFIPQNDEEQEKIQQLRRCLGFNPCEAADQLTATQGQKKEGAKRDAKEVMRALVADPQREVACWEETPLAELRRRGTAVGLTEYLRQVEDRVVPLFIRGGARPDL